MCLSCRQNKIKNKKGKTHELLTVDFARFNRANNGDYMTTQFNRENNNEKSYDSNKVSLNSKGRINTTYKKRYSIVQSTILLLSWLFVVVMGFALIFNANINTNNNNLIGMQKKVVAEGTNEIFSNGIGDGTINSPYQISTMADLEFLSKNSSYWSANFLQVEDIPYESSSWTPIGNDITNFTGNYNGGGHKITFTNSIKISGEYGGVFGYISSNAVIQNLGANWNGKNNISVYSHSLQGLVCEKNEQSSGDSLNVGGIVGYAVDSAVVKNCYTKGSLNAYARSGSYAAAGGIVGVANGEVAVSNCYSMCDIKGCCLYAMGNLAGIVGRNVGQTIVKCYSISHLEDLGSMGYGTNHIDTFHNYSNCFAYTYSSNGGRGLGVDTLDELKQESTFNTNSNVETDWDFTTIWGINSETNEGYPYLRVFEEYSITYKAGDGTGDDVLKYYGLKTSLPQATLPNGTSSEIGFTAPSGKEFDCWMDESSTNHYVDDKITLTENLVLTAQWKVPYIDFNIALDANGGTLGSVTQIEVLQSVPQKTQLTGGELPTRNGYTFNGYYTSQTGGTMYVNSDGQVVLDTSYYLNEISTLYAQWQHINYTITYYIVKDGIASIWSDSGNPTNYNIETNAITVNTPTNVGNQYNYKGWSTTQTGTTSNNTLTIPKGTTGNLTYYFIYETKTLTLTLNCKNYSNQDYFVYIYKDGQMKYQLYVQDNATIKLEYIDGYQAGQYSIRLVTSYLGNVQIAENGTDNITLNGKEIKIDTFANTTINYTISSYNGNNFVVI